MYTLYGPSISMGPRPPSLVISIASPFQFAGGGELRWPLSLRERLFDVHVLSRELQQDRLHWPRHREAPTARRYC